MADPCCCTEAETWVTLGTRPPCSAAKEGQLWFNALKKDLLVCSSQTWTWTSLLQSQLPTNAPAPNTYLVGPIHFLLG